MSIIERLTEGMVQRDMKQEGEALLEKWTRTGLLEGLDSSQSKHNMARLLENQAKELLREASSMSNGDVEGFAAVAFPIVRRVFAGLIANELVSVQPMSLPSGLIFFLDFAFGDEQGGSAATSPRMGNVADGTASIYGTDKLASGIASGVNLVGTQSEDQSGPRGMTGYAYSSPSGSNFQQITVNTQADAACKAAFKLDGSVSETFGKLIDFDPDLLAETTLGCAIIDINEDEIMSATGLNDADYENLSAFQWTPNAELAASLNADSRMGGIAHAEITQIRRLTRRVSATEAGTANASVRFVFTFTNGTDVTGTESAVAEDCEVFALGTISFPVKDHMPAGASVGSVQSTSTNYLLEKNPSIPEIDIKVDSIAITAQTKKLKAKWTPELGQDLNAYHNLDAEVELTSILSEQIALEIDREILADLVNGATAGTFYWSRSPGLFVDRVNGTELGATSAAPDFTGTVSEWYETLIETINDVSAQIHRKTLRGGANFVVCSPEVANILEFTSGFRANVTADADKGDIGAVKTGSLSRKFDVLVDPYFPRMAVLVGRRGSSFLESGYVYAPYVPLQVTPTIFGVEDFVPRKGVMTRYAKKMVRPDMYGLVIVRGLLGEAGS